MTKLSFNQVDEVLFSFSYSNVQQASRCNEKLSQLMGQSIVSELEAGFDQLNYSGLQLELETLEVNLGKLSEEDISYRLGERIKWALLETLKKEVNKRIGVDPFNSKSSSPQSEDFALSALRSFFLKGYFPSWVDKTWDLLSILEELLQDRPSSFGQMIREISRQNAAARKRIAFLNTTYFDRIIEVLVPGDAAWILDYRDSYVKIHDSDSKLPGSSEDLERALNLFILNFIAQDSGPKFNRLSFSNRFLNEIAAHYNLDFKLFLKEIKRLVADLPLNNPLQQDFKEAINFVGEKNLGADYLDYDEFEPTQAELVTWLNQSNVNTALEKWVSNLELNGILFQELANRYPSFWKNLSPVGLTNFLNLLSNVNAPLWQSLAEDFIRFNVSQTSETDPVQKSDYLKGVFDFAYEHYNSLDLRLFDLSDWFAVHLLFLFYKSKQEPFHSQELIEIGLAKGISTSPLIWKSAKKKITKIKPSVQNTSSLKSPHGTELLNFGKRDISISDKQGQNQEIILLEYLNSGPVKGFSGKWKEQDLIDIVSDLIKDQNPIILNWIKKSNLGQSTSFGTRLRELVAKVNKKQLLDYAFKVEGSEFLNVLRPIIDFPKPFKTETEEAVFSKSTDFNEKTVLDQNLDEAISNANNSKSKSFQKLALFGYLNSGTLGDPFRNLAVGDLEDLLAAFVKDKNPVLIEWIKKTQCSTDSPMGQRLWGLVRKLDRKDFLNYISSDAGLRTQKLVELEKVIGQLFELPDLRNMQLDHFIWSNFLADVASERRGRKSLGLSHSLNLSCVYLSLLSKGFSSAKGDLGKIRILRNSLNSLKNLMLVSSLNSDSDKYFGALPAYFSLIRSFSTSEQSVYLIKTFKSKTERMDLNSFRLDEKYWAAKYFSNSLLNDFYLLWSGENDKSNTESPKKEALTLLKSDVNQIKRFAHHPSFDSYKKSELKAAVNRIFIGFNADPAILYPLLLKSKAHLFIMLPLFRANLKPKDWTTFSSWLEKYFGDEYKRFKDFRGSKDESLIDSLNLSGIELKDGLESNSKRSSLLHQPLTQSDILKSFKEEINKRFQGNSKITADLIFLFNLPDSVFSNRQTAVFWRRMFLLSLAQLKGESATDSQVLYRLFWKKINELAAGNFSKFGGDSMDWDFVLKSSGLNSKSQLILSRLIRSNDLDKKEGVRDSSFDQSLSGSILFLKAEGYLPWWSPIKSKFGLIQELLYRIEFSQSDEASSLVSVLVSGNIKRLISGMRGEELQRLKQSLLSSVYHRYFRDLEALIDAQISTPEIRSLKSTPSREKKGLSNRLDAKNFKGLTAVQLEKELKRRLNAGQEASLVRSWFGIDPRIQKQINDLLAWSPMIYFGSLNPSKWKLWLLTFGFDFYVNRGQSFSRGFLSQFLSYLIKSQSAINWKGVVHQLIRNKEFLNDQNKFYRAELLTLFPIEEKASVIEAKTGDQVRVKNAGLILCWPFLSVLFSRLKLSAGNRIPEENHSKAVYLLQHLVFGHTDFPEYELVLNKIMVGMKSGQHLERVELSKEEKDMTESLLFGMKSNWEKMKNASVDAIRETFLQREGILEFGDESFILRVPKTGVDILLDSVSWNIAFIRMPWMEKSLEVKWR